VFEQILTFHGEHQPALSCWPKRWRWFDGRQVGGGHQCSSCGRPYPLKDWVESAVIGHHLCPACDERPPCRRIGDGDACPNAPWLTSEPCSHGWAVRLGDVAAVDGVFWLLVRGGSVERCHRERPHKLLWRPPRTPPFCASRSKEQRACQGYPRLGLPLKHELYMHVTIACIFLVIGVCTPLSNVGVDRVEEVNGASVGTAAYHGIDLVNGLILLLMALVVALQWMSNGCVIVCWLLQRTVCRPTQPHGQRTQIFCVTPAGSLSTWFTTSCVKWCLPALAYPISSPAKEIYIALYACMIVLSSLALLIAVWSGNPTLPGSAAEHVLDSSGATPSVGLLRRLFTPRARALLVEYKERKCAGEFGIEDAVDRMHGEASTGAGGGASMKV
jgi:hypothetical protein